jgi:hypothetical protein
MFLSVLWYITHVSEALATAIFIIRKRPETLVIYQYVWGNSPEQWNSRFSRDFFQFLRAIEEVCDSAYNF